MKKVLIILLAILFVQVPSFSAKKKMEPVSGGKNNLPNIFIYTIPDDNEIQQDKEIIPQNTPKENYIDDKEQNTESEEEILLNMKEESPQDDTEPVLGATVLKGYAEYVEDAEEIYLKDEDNNFVLNLKVPQKISSSESLDFKNYSQTKQISRFKNTEYNIAPKSVNAQEKKGNFTFGALYGNEVDNIAMLESETGLFTKYEKNKFALSTTYKKNLNTTYNKFYDTISVAPEFKLNNYMSIRNEYKADITRNRKSGSLIFSFNPLAKKEKDRWILELGAKHTIYDDNVTTKSEFSFSTKFKL